MSWIEMVKIFVRGIQAGLEGAGACTRISSGLGLKVEGRLGD